MSSALKKRNTEAYDGNLMDSYGFPKVSGLFKQTNVSSNVNSILQRKSDVSRAIDTTRHTTDGTSVTKQPKIPSSQEYVSDIATFQQFQGASTVSRKAILSKRKDNKNPFGDSPIFDADYVDMESSGKYKVLRVSRKPSEAPRKASKEDDIVWITGAEDSSRKFRKAPAKDARDLGLTQRTKSVEPSAISAISETKTKAKQSLKKRPTKQVPSAAETFDYVIGQFKGKGKSDEVQTVPKKRHSLKSNIVRGIQDINEITDEISKNGNLQRIKQQQESDIKALRSANRHLKSSIAACANSKKGLTAGSLVKQRTIGTRTNTQAVASYPSQNQVIPKVIHRKGGDIVKYFLPNGMEISAAVAKKLVNGNVSVLPHTIEASTTTAQANQTYNTGTIVKKMIKTASGLVRRHKNRLRANQRTKGAVNKPRFATASGIVTRHRGV